MFVPLGAIFVRKHLESSNKLDETKWMLYAPVAQFG
jgi:hypothetical protein